jgi:hypothetical protein
MNAKANRRLVGDDEDEDLDPAMYLDPTITITLINNDEKIAVSKHVNDISSASSISSSDLQVLILFPLVYKEIFQNCFLLGLECSGRECVHHSCA